MTHDLSSLRREIRAARRALPADQRSVADAAINSRLVELIGVLEPRRVSSYLTTDGEPDLAPLHAVCADSGVEVVVPVMGTDRVLVFRPLGIGPLVVNAAGIPEPHGGDEVEVASIDIVLAPLVAFDRHGNRAGRGGGWYDRALARRTPDQRIVGVAYELQRRVALPTHEGDVPLDMVVTDVGTHRCPRTDGEGTRRP